MNGPELIPLAALLVCAAGAAQCGFIAMGAAMHSGAEDPSLTRATEHDAYAYGFGIAALILAGLAGALAHGAFQ